MTYRSSDSKRLPEKYYVRRRIAAAVVLLIAVALVIWGLVAWGGSRGDDGEATTAPTTSPMAAPAAEESEDEITMAEDTTRTAPESSDPVPADEEQPQSPYPEAEEEAPTEPASDSCEVGDLVITADSDQPTYPAGDMPTFYMTVENPTGADCEIDLDEQTLRFEVYDLATNQRVWSDVDCFDAMESGEETFEAESSRYFEAVWSRTASAPGQCSDRPTVPDGSYFLHAVVGDNPSPAHTFNVAA